MQKRLLNDVIMCLSSLKPAILQIMNPTGRIAINLIHGGGDIRILGQIPSLVEFTQTNASPIRIDPLKKARCCAD